jgi:hypothetical protein
MSMAEAPARVSLVAAVSAATCELCMAANAAATATVLVQHARGGSVELAACDPCVHALRRLSAATGGYATFVLGEATAPPGTARVGWAGTAPVSPPVFIAELTVDVQDAAGTRFVPRIFGRERADGTWEGWLDFVDPSSGSVLRTGRETTQSNREGVAYWASGLEPSYLEGAFARARPV